jgi:N-acylneuraminate cytidylyltransferase
MKRIAIIPARSGSKRLRDKNIIDICGKPMIAYSIEAALQSKMFDRVIVSTDSELYRDISLQYGAEVFMRSAELSSDTATTYMVLEDIIHKLNGDFDYFMLLQPTSPLRRVENILEACQLFESRMSDMDFLISVVKSHLPSRYIKPIAEDGSMKHFIASQTHTRTQDYQEYTLNGAIYIAKPAEYLKDKNFMGPNSLAYIMNEEDSADVDNHVDYLTACCIIARRQGCSGITFPDIESNRI